MSYIPETLKEIKEKLRAVEKEFDAVDEKNASKKAFEVRKLIINNFLDLNTRFIEKNQMDLKTLRKEVIALEKTFRKALVEEAAATPHNRSSQKGASTAKEPQSNTVKSNVKTPQVEEKNDWADFPDKIDHGFSFDKLDHNVIGHEMNPFDNDPKQFATGLEGALPEGVSWNLDFDQQTGTTPKKLYRDVDYNTSRQKELRLGTIREESHDDESRATASRLRAGFNFDDFNDVELKSDNARRLPAHSRPTDGKSPRISSKTAPSVLPSTPPTKRPPSTRSSTQ